MSKYCKLMPLFQKQYRINNGIEWGFLHKTNFQHLCSDEVQEECRIGRLVQIIFFNLFKQWSILLFSAKCYQDKIMEILKSWDPWTPNLFLTHPPTIKPSTVFWDASGKLSKITVDKNQEYSDVHQNGNPNIHTFGV